MGASSVSADLVFWDMPYGLGVAHWDVLLTDVELETFGHQLACVCRARNFCLVLSVIFHDAGRIRAWMLANGFCDIHPIYVYKPQQNTTGMDWIFAVEMMLAGYKGGMKNCKMTFSESTPLLRHNLMFAHQVGSKLKHAGEDSEVNTTQKNPNIASALGRIICRPGSVALVIGAGSGSEVVGLARAGVNVVGLERDPKQFRGLTERLTHEMSFSAPALAQAENEQKSVTLLNLLASRFTRLNPDYHAHFLESVDAEADSESAPSHEVGAADRAPLPRQCPSCGKDLKQKDEFECEKDGCQTGKMHTTCCEKCSKCAKLFCTADCVENHGCQC
jgi:hypothetical protein